MGKKTIYITEKQLSEIKKKNKKVPSAMDQVHNKVNAGIMDAVTCGGLCEDKEGMITLYHGVNPDKLEHNLEVSGFEPRVCSEGGPKAIWLSKKDYGYPFVFRFEIPKNLVEQMTTVDYICTQPISFNDYNCKLIKTQIRVPFEDFIVDVNILSPKTSKTQFNLFSGLGDALLDEFKQYPKITETYIKPFLEEMSSINEEQEMGVETEILYRGHKPEHGLLGLDNLIWLTDDISYAKEYGDVIEEVVLNSNKLSPASIYRIDDYCEYDFDYYAGPNEDLQKELLKDGFNCYWFEANDDMSECLCLWDTNAIISHRNMSQEEVNAAIEELQEGAEPENDEYKIAGEGGNNEYFHAINESPDVILVLGKHFRDADAVPFIRLKCNGKLYVDNVCGRRHIDIIHELELKGEIEKIDFDGLPYSEFAYEIETGRYWKDVNAISCWAIPKTKQELDEFYNLIYELEDALGIEIDRKTLYVDMWKRYGGGTCVIPYSWLFNGIWEDNMYNIRSVTPLKDKNAFIVYTYGGKWIITRNGKTLSEEDYFKSMATEPAVAPALVSEGLSSKEYDFERDLKSILDFMREEGLNVYPYPEIKLDWESQDGLFIRTGYYEPETKTVVIFCKDRHPKDILRSAAHEFIHHTQNLDGKDLNFTSADDVKDNKRLEEIEAEAYLKGNIYFRKWTEYKHSKDILQEGKKVVKNDEGQTVPEKCDKCGGDITLQIHGEPVYLCKDCGKYFGTMPFPKNLDESILQELEPEDVDLSSFNVKHQLNPKFWKDGVLDSRIRLKLLDISDDFIDTLNVEWAEPKDIVITGSLANFNWHKDYSDIDLHILYDFSDIDENTEFVKEYFDSKKKIWNEEHKDLTVYGFPVEVYVQDVNEKHASSGVYSLDKNDWVIEGKWQYFAKNICR